jgi:hypothetical protein
VTKAHWHAHAPISPVIVDGINVAKPENVNFDIAIAAERRTNGGLKVVTLGEFSGERTAQTISRVSFSVPVYFGGKKLKSKEVESL